MRHTDSYHVLIAMQRLVLALKPTLRAVGDYPTIADHVNLGLINRGIVSTLVVVADAAGGYNQSWLGC
jgi:hypothetical protein